MNDEIEQNQESVRALLGEMTSSRREANLQLVDLLMKFDEKLSGYSSREENTVELAVVEKIRSDLLDSNAINMKMEVKLQELAAEVRDLKEKNSFIQKDLENARAKVYELEVSGEKQKTEIKNLTVSQDGWRQGFLQVREHVEAMVADQISSDQRVREQLRSVQSSIDD